MTTPQKPAKQTAEGRSKISPMEHYLQNQLRDFSETSLLEFVRIILSKNNPLSLGDKIELQQINNELVRRDTLKAQNICHYCKETLSGGPRCSHCGAL